MFETTALSEHLQDNWRIWIVTITLIVAAVIDGYKLKVPNWLTFPFILSGLVVGAVTGGWSGFGFALLGMIVGLALLLPAYAIGGMGAGDVKLLAGVGAWIGTMDTLYAFCVSAVVGGVIAILMVLYRRAWSKHYYQFLTIWNEMVTIRDPEQLATIAAERKSTMLLLPYGIPIAIGTIAYFAFMGMLL
jgi:prepilin peptidase CpaA